MEIAIVTGDASPALATDDEPGGRHARLAALARALGARGHRVVVYGRTCRPDLADRVALTPDVEVRHVQAGPARALDTAGLLETVAERAAWLARCWAADRPDIVHACGWDAGLAALGAARDLPGLPVVHERLGEEPVRPGEEPPGPEVAQRLHRLWCAMVRSALAAVAQSRHEADQLVRLGLPRHRIQVIPPGIDTDHFAPPPVPGRPGRRGPGRVLCLDGRDGGHGLATIVTAMSGVPRAHLTVAGGRPPLSSPSRRGGPPHSIDFVGPVPHRTVPRLLHSTDVLATAPRTDDGGSAALEAMACGVPVVAASTGVLQDLVVDQVTGLLVPAGRADLMADAVRQLLHRDARRYALGIAGADRARSRHSWSRIATELEEFHRRWASRPASDTPVAPAR